MAGASGRAPGLSVSLPPEQYVADMPLSATLSQLLPDLPPISALFLIDFDVKAGYTIVWKRALPALEPQLEGAVEYKSLPSGLHAVAEDLVYFVHDDEDGGSGHAGLSAFVNARTDEEETRHARMIAVGVLVPLSYGRLGRAWRHAKSLREMARQLSKDRGQTQLLEDYWEKAKARVGATRPPLHPLGESLLTSPALPLKPSRLGAKKGHMRNRSASDGAALLAPGHRLSPFHPVWSLTALLDTFGPLIFPIHRAALLRKRILISTHAPVHEVCNFVYDISIISNIPLSVFDIIDPSASAQRLRPLFTVGVHDIPYLQTIRAVSRRASRLDVDNVTVAEDVGSGWVACTTDSILAMKGDLWDVLVTMPPNQSANTSEKVWPTVEYTKGFPVKATQRDLRRFRSLKQGLARLAALSAAGRRDRGNSAVQNDSNHQDPFGSAESFSRPGKGTRSEEANFGAARSIAAIDEHDVDAIVEPTTWAALAYNGFMWWASAGEQRRSEEAEEAAHDAGLLADLAPAMPSVTHQQQQADGGNGLTDSITSLTAVGGSDGNEDDEGEGDEEQARLELAIIAYFHRLTTSVLGVLAEIVDITDDDDMMDMRPMAGAVGRSSSAARRGDEDEDEEEAEDAALLGRYGDSDDEDGEDDGNRRGWIRVDGDALARMGLDAWSKADAAFVREVAARYFARRAYVEIKGVEVCGLRVC